MNPEVETQQPVQEQPQTQTTAAPAPQSATQPAPAPVAEPVSVDPAEDLFNIFDKKLS